MEKTEVRLVCLGFLAICVIGLGASDFLLVRTAQAEEIAGRVVAVAGKVLIRADNAAESTSRALKVGDRVSAHEVINTASQASAKLLMTDETIVDLGASTLFKVSEYRLKKGNDRQVTLSMNYGKIRAVVNQAVGQGGKFRVRTKAATMGVRGTEFVVAADLGSTQTGPQSEAATTQITVVKGVVAVDTSAPGSASKPGSSQFSLTAGQQIATVATASGDSGTQTGTGATATGSGTGAGAGSSPRVTTLSSAQVSSVKSEAKIGDNTMKAAVSVDQSDGGGSGGASTLRTITQATGAPPPVRINVNDLGLPGTFNNNLGLGGSFFPGVIGTSAAIRVVFTP